MYKKKWICQKCDYETNKKQNYEKHISRPSACEKRLKRHHDKNTENNVGDNVNNVGGKINNVGDNVNNVGDKINNVGDNVNNVGDNINDKTTSNISTNSCKKCKKSFSTYNYLLKHEAKCKGITNPLQCPTCKKVFSSRFTKYEHIKNVKCEFVEIKDEKDILIEELREELEEEREKLKEKNKQLEEERARPTTVYNTTNNTTNNYFDHSINYNNYDNLNVDHITKEDIKRLFNNCRMQYPELSEDLTRMILSPKENQCIYLPEGQKSNTCAVIKDGVEMRKPLIRVLMDLGVQTAMLIRDSNVIVRNKKDVVNNQFWADNRNACGLNISDIEYMTENDKEIVQRNKNIVLDMSDGKI